MKNNQRVRASTFHHFAAAEADEPRGRFGTIGKPTVTGASPTPPYPVLPQASPWHDDPVPPEPPISFQDMAAVEPTGTHAEIAKSLPDVCSDVVPPASGHASDEVRSAVRGPVSKRLRRSFSKRK